MRWNAQWDSYKALLLLNPVVLDFSKGPIQDNIDFGEIVINSHPDDKGMHKAIDEGNLNKVYSYLPKEHIDHAIKCCGDLYGDS
jgi:hypothetical protein